MDISSIAISFAVIPLGYVSSNTESLPGTSSVNTDRTGILSSPTMSIIVFSSSSDKSSTLVKSTSLAFLGALIFGVVFVVSLAVVVGLVVGASVGIEPLCTFSCPYIFSVIAPSSFSSFLENVLIVLPSS